MAIENVNRPDNFYRESLHRLHASIETLARGIRPQLDRIQMSNAVAAQRLAKLAAKPMP